MLTPTDISHCTSLGIRGTPSDIQAGGGTSTAFDPLGTRPVTVENVSHVAYPRDAHATVFGQVAHDTTRVVVTLDDGTKVQSSVRDGWYLAWWPENVQRAGWRWSVDECEPRTIQAYDSAGDLLGQTRV